MYSAVNFMKNKYAKVRTSSSAIFLSSRVVNIHYSYFVGRFLRKLCTEAFRLSNSASLEGLEETAALKVFMNCLLALLARAESELARAI